MSQEIIKGQVATYTEANQAYYNRTDWHELPLIECAFELCGQHFRQEVVGQTLCRDCQSCQGLGSYAPGVPSTHDFDTRTLPEDATAFNEMP
jgi:hypothetical protein